MREEEEEERVGAPVVHMDGGVGSFFLSPVLLSLSASPLSLPHLSFILMVRSSFAAAQKVRPSRSPSPLSKQSTTYTHM